jgi:hypothetical protein
MMAQRLIRENMVDAYVDLIAQFLHKAFSTNPEKNPVRAPHAIFLEGRAPARP